MKPDPTKASQEDIQYLREMFPFYTTPDAGEVTKAPPQIPEPQKTSLVDVMPKKPPYDLKAIRETIKADESAGAGDKIYSPYKDSKGLPTIGHGHLITKESPKIFGAVFAEEHKKDNDFGAKVLGGKQRLTTEQADRLLDRDVTIRMPEVEKLVPKFSNFSPSLQASLASEHFRGMLGQSKKTLGLINQGKYVEASGEYLNAREYREAVQQKSGVAKRMQRLANELKNYKEPVK